MVKPRSELFEVKYGFLFSPVRKIPRGAWLRLVEMPWNQETLAGLYDDPNETFEYPGSARHLYCPKERGVYFLAVVDDQTSGEYWTTNSVRVDGQKRG